MIINTYFSKNNTIILNKETNTGKNPVTELFYGGDTVNYSRFLFKIDTDRIEELIVDGHMYDLNKCKHTIKLTNASFFDWDLQGRKFLDKTRASSFDLVLFKLEQEWDEGVGYDFIRSGLVNKVDVYSDAPSNWFKSRSNDLWVTPGALNPGSIISTQHFESGSENLEIDVTDAINSFLDGEINYGFGLAFAKTFENSQGIPTQYVGFFTNQSQTVYEPYLQTYYDDTIQDDRLNFKIDKLNRLYLYVKQGEQYIDLDGTPTAEIFDASGNSIQLFNPADIKKFGRGIYYIEFSIHGDESDCSIFVDVWSGLKLNGRNISNVEMDFTLKNVGYLNIGNPSPRNETEITLSVNGIKDGEAINRGVLRNVFILPKINYTYGQLDQDISLEWRLFMKEGPNEITIFDYTKTNTLYGGEKNFLLDTMSLLPNKYYMDIRYKRKGNYEMIKNIISFSVVSETENREKKVVNRTPVTPQPATR